MSREEFATEMRAFVRDQLSDFRRDNLAFYAEGKRFKKRAAISCKRLDAAIARDRVQMGREAA